MLILPAIDLYEQKAVRLYQGDYSRMEVYSDDPAALAAQFEAAGAQELHMVDLEGAKGGTTPHLALVEKIVRQTNLTVELGGGIRTMQTAERYLSCGVSRVILQRKLASISDYGKLLIRKEALLVYQTGADGEVLFRCLIVFHEIMPSVNALPIKIP